MRNVDDLEEKIRQLRRELPEEDFKKKIKSWIQMLNGQVERYKADAVLLKREGNTVMAEGQKAAARVIQKKIDRLMQELPYSEKPVAKRKQIKRKQKKVKKNNKAAAVFSMLAAETKGEKK